MNVTGAFGTTSKEAVGVVVIDTGISRNLPDPMRSAIDYEDGVALTSFVDDLASLGVCNDTGTYTFSNLTLVEYLWPPFNYTLPTDVSFRYCLVADRDENSTLVILQAEELSDQVGHGTFVASQIVGDFDGVTKYVYSSPYSNIIERAEYVDKVVTGVAAPSTGARVYVIPIKADFLILYSWDNAYSTLKEFLGNVSVEVSDGVYYLKNTVIDGGYFDDYSLGNATIVASKLAREGKAKVVNFSLGWWTDYTGLDISCRAVISPLLESGLTVVAAAGNNGIDIELFNQAYDLYLFPAQCDGVIAVSAFGPANDLAWFSNYDPATFGAPGHVVLGLYPGDSMLAMASLWETSPYGGDSNSNLLTWSSCTSYSSPEVAGAIAYLYSLGLTLDDIKNNARDVALKKYSGYGFPAVGDYLRLLNQHSSSEDEESSAGTNRVPALGVLALPFLGKLRRRFASK